MAGNIKGITIEIDGNATGLSKALNSINGGLKTTQSALKQVDSLLKFNPSSTTLLEQKQRLLATAIEGTKKKLDALKEAQEKASEALASGDISQSEYDALTRQVEKTTQELGKLESQQEDCATQSELLASSSQQVVSPLEQLTSTISSQESELDELKTKYMNAALAYGENSEQAQNLKGKIETLSTELNDNKQKLSDVENAANDAGDAIEESGEQADGAATGGWTVIGGVISNLASDIIQGAIDKIKEFGKSVMDTGIGFSQEMSKVQALSGASAEEMELLEQTARAYGATTQYSATEAAEALGYMALAGWDAQTSADNLGGVLYLAAAAGMDLGAASDMVTDYLSAFSGTAMTSTEMANMLAYAQGNSNTSAAQLGEAYKNCAANLNAAGQDFQTTTSFLEAMANQGLKGSEAGTALNAVMRDITKNMYQVEDAAGAAGLAEAGMSSVTGDLNDLIGMQTIQIGDMLIPVADAQGNFRDLTDIMMDVETATAGMGDAEKASALQTTFTSDATKGLNLILNEGMENVAGYEVALRGASVTSSGFGDAATNAGIPIDDMRKKLEEAGVSADEFDDALAASEGDADKFVAGLAKAADEGEDVSSILEDLGISMEDLQTAMDDSTGSAEEMANTMNDNLAGDLAELGSATDELKLQIYDIVEGPAREAVSLVTDEIIPALSEALNWMTEHSTLLGVIAGIIGIVTVAMGLQAAAQAIQTAMNAAEVTSLGALIAAKWASAAASMAALAPYILIVAAIAAVIAIIVLCVTHWEQIKQTVITVATACWTAITTRFAAIKTAITTAVSNAWSTVTTYFGNIKSTITTAATTAWTTVTSKFNAIKTSITTAISGAYTTVTTKFNSIKTTITNAINTARSTVTTAVNAIKNAFNFSWSLPKIKLPHFSIGTGPTVLGVSLPSISVSWYKKAYDEAMVLSNPTVFGASGNALLAGGEGHGNEVVSGEAHLMDLISQASGAEAMYAVLEAIQSLDNKLYGKIYDAVADQDTASQRDMKRMVRRYV